MIKQQYLTKKKLELEGSWWLLFKHIAIGFYVLAGRWISLGIHLSIVPLYVDFHVGWIILSIMSRKRSAEIMDYEEAYCEN